MNFFLFLGVKRFCPSLWAVSPGGRLRQPGRCRTPQSQAERDGECTGVYQLGGAQSADPAPRAAGAISTPGEVTQLQDSVRLANLGQPTLVKGE